MGLNKILSTQVQSPHQFKIYTGLGVKINAQGTQGTSNKYNKYISNIDNESKC